MSRAVFALIAGSILAIAFVYFVVVPGVNRGGWIEVIGVVLAIAAIATFDRWSRRLRRRR